MRPRRHVALRFLLVLSSMTSIIESANAGPSATEVLTRAFARPYACDFGMRMSLEMIDRWGDRSHRRLVVASKRIRGRRHVVARITHPLPLQKTALLTIENRGRSPDVFVFLPSLGRSRRIASAQAADSLLGTDLTYEDLERRSVGDYAVVDSRLERIAGEQIHVLETRPVGASRHEMVTLHVSQSSYDLRGMHYFSGARKELAKVVEFSSYRESPGRDCAIPTRIVAHTPRRGTRTELNVEALHIESEFDDSLFSIRFLESGSRIEMP